LLSEAVQKFNVCSGYERRFRDVRDRCAATRRRFPVGPSQDKLKIVVADRKTLL
jgi:hypothetical protein